MKTHWKDLLRYYCTIEALLLLSILQERKQPCFDGSFCQRLFLQFASCCQTIRSMNYSNSSSALELDNTLSIERTLVLSLLSFLTSLAVIGNIFILICIIGNAALQRPGHLFIASLALADLILALTVMIPRLSDEILGGWHFGHFLCQVYHAMDVTLCTSSILHLGSISIDRYLAVVDRPLLYEVRVTHERVALAILGCWILAGLTGFLPVFTGIYSDPEHLQNSIENAAMTCDLVVNKYFSVIAGVISFWIPGSVMTWVYFHVYHEARRLSSNEGAHQDLKETSAEEMGNKHFHVNHQNHQRESRTAVTLGIVMGVFVICWLPFFIWMPVTSLFELQTPRMLYDAILWIGYGNSALNPFIYGFFCKEFRSVMSVQKGKMSKLIPKC